MPYMYNDITYDTLTTILHVLGLLYCVPILIRSILLRNEVPIPEKAFRKLTSQQDLGDSLNDDEDDLHPVDEDGEAEDEETSAERELRIHRTFIKYTICAIVLYTLCLLFCVIYNMPLDPPMDHDRQNIFAVFARQCWNFGQILCYLIFTHRLKHCFAGTEYEIPSKYYKFFYVSIALFGAGELIISFTIFLESVDALSVPQFVTIAMVESLCKTMFSILLSVSMIYLFVSALLRISVDEDYGRDSFDESCSSLLLKLEQILKDNATQLSVLSFFSLLSTQIFVLFGSFIFILWRAAGAHDLSELAGALWCYNMCWVAAITVNVTCLFLNVPSSQSMYDKWCQRCHQKGHLLGDRKVEDLRKRIERQYTASYHLSVKGHSESRPSSRKHSKRSTVGTENSPYHSPQHGPSMTPDFEEAELGALHGALNGSALDNVPEQEEEEMVERT